MWKYLIRWLRQAERYWRLLQSNINRSRWSIGYLTLQSNDKLTCQISDMLFFTGVRWNFGLSLVCLGHKMIEKTTEIDNSKVCFSHFMPNNLVFCVIWWSGPTRNVNCVIIRYVSQKKKGKTVRIYRCSSNQCLRPFNNYLNRTTTHIQQVALGYSWTSLQLILWSCIAMPNVVIKQINNLLSYENYIQKRVLRKTTLWYLSNLKV